MVAMLVDREVGWTAILTAGKLAGMMARKMAVWWANWKVIVKELNSADWKAISKVA